MIDKRPAKEALATIYSVWRSNEPPVRIIAAGVDDEGVLYTAINGDTPGESIMNYMDVGGH